MSWCQNVSVPEYLVVIMSGCQKGGCQSVLVSKCPVPKCRRTPGLSMVGVLKAPKFGYVPELLKIHCQ